MTAPDRSEWDQLNAFVDGELPPEERRAMHERARHDPLLGLQIAGLRRLKSEVRSAGRPRRLRRLAITAVVVSVAAVGVGVGVLGSADKRQSEETVVARLVEVVQMPVSPGSPSRPGVAEVPDLEPAGFKLASAIGNTPDGIGLVYHGPRGCRIGLAIFAPGTRARVDAGADARIWTVEGRGFALLAPGMEPDRFARLALAVEGITRGGDAATVRVALRDATVGRPCLG